MAPSEPTGCFSHNTSGNRGERRDEYRHLFDSLCSYADIPVMQTSKYRNGDECHSNQCVVFRSCDGRSRRATLLRGMGRRSFHKARGFGWLQMHGSYSRPGRARGRGNRSPRTSVAKVLRTSRLPVQDPRTNDSPVEHLQGVTPGSVVF